MQQFTEGILWLSLQGWSPGDEKILTHIYIFFAQVLWPIYIPMAFLYLEKNGNRKMLLKILVGAGIFVGGYLAYCLLTYEVRAEIVGNHIKYLLDYPRPLRGYGNLLYGLATVAPALFQD